MTGAETLARTLRDRYAVAAAVLNRRCMILTPVPPRQLPRLLDRFGDFLDDPWSAGVFWRIARVEDGRRAAGPDARAHHAEALMLLASFGIAIAPGRPSDHVSWDGMAARGDIEAYVLLHEAAHFQLAAPERRRSIDFALGPGPETGNRDAASRAARVFGLAREREEAMASLLGILWEVELGHPALASFIDQNWLEGAERPGAAKHFRTILAQLRDGGHVDSAGRPRRILRQSPDAG
jgi:hypothetical protein